MRRIADWMSWNQAFDGGLYLPDERARTARLPIERMAVGETLWVPLQVRGDEACEPVVTASASVLGGQLLAGGGSVGSAAVYAPTSGRLARFDRVWTAWHGFVRCAVLEPDSRDAWAEVRPFASATATEEVREALPSSGILCDRSGRSLHAVLVSARSARADVLIINGLETEPYLTVALRLLVERGVEAVGAARRLGEVGGFRRTVLAVSQRHRRLVRRLRDIARTSGVEVVPLPDKYPQCHPLLLIHVLLDRRIAAGGSAIDAGVCVISTATLAAFSQWMATGRPPVTRVLTVAGGAVARPGTYEVAIGTPIARVLERAEASDGVECVVSGGPLTGVAVARSDAVVSVLDTAVLALEAAPRPGPVPCVRCGWCIEDCPVGIDPTSLVQLEGRSACSAEELVALRSCIDCGLCTYVCPAELPLAESISRSRARFSSRGEVAT